MYTNIHHCHYGTALGSPSGGHFYYRPILLLKMNKHEIVKNSIKLCADFMYFLSKVKFVCCNSAQEVFTCIFSADKLQKLTINKKHTVH